MRRRGRAAPRPRGSLQANEIGNAGAQSYRSKSWFDSPQSFFLRPSSNARPHCGSPRARLSARRQPRPHTELGYVAKVRGGGVAGSGTICPTASPRARGAFPRAPASATPMSGTGSVLTSSAAPTATRESPHGSPWAAGRVDGRCSARTGLHTGHAAWSPPLAQVQTCAAVPCRAPTSPGNPRPAASIATTIARTT